MPIQETEITDIGSLLAAARKALPGFGKAQYIFRGHADSSWQLVPSVYRDYDRRGEKNLAGRFRIAAPTRHSRGPGLTDEPGWMSLMQHFRLPTRLLDWTGSLLTAAYFAVAHEAKLGPAAIWALFPNKLNEASSHSTGVHFLLHGPEAGPLIAAAFSGSACADDVLAVLPVEIDVRMTVQMSSFTLHTTAEPLEKRGGAEKYLLAKFVIPEVARSAFADELWMLGARRSVLFPDLANLAQELTSDDRIVTRKNS